MATSRPTARPRPAAAATPVEPTSGRHPAAAAATPVALISWDEAMRLYQEAPETPVKELIRRTGMKPRAFHQQRSCRGIPVRERPARSVRTLTVIPRAAAAAPTGRTMSDRQMVCALKRQRSALVHGMAGAPLLDQERGAKTVAQLTRTIDEVEGRLAAAAAVRTAVAAPVVAPSQRRDAFDDPRSDEDDADDIVAMRAEIARRFERFCEDEGHWELLALLTGRPRAELER